MSAARHALDLGHHILFEDVKETLELFERPRVLVDPNVPERVLLAIDDVDGGRVFALAVAPLGVAGLQGVHQPPRQGQLEIAQQGFSRTLQYLRSRDSVPLDRKALAGEMSRPVGAARSGMNRCPTSGIHNRD